METTGQRLKKIRSKLHLSQEDFGHKLNLSRAGIAAVEADNNKFSQDVLCKLLLTFNVNINYLLGGKGNMFLTPNFEDVEDEFTQKVEAILRKHNIVLKD